MRWLMLAENLGVDVDPQSDGVKEDDPSSIIRAKVAMFNAKTAVLTALAKKFEAEERYWDRYAGVRDVEEDLLKLEKQSKTTSAELAGEVRKLELEVKKLRLTQERARLEKTPAGGEPSSPQPSSYAGKEASHRRDPRRSQSPSGSSPTPTATAPSTP